MHAWHFDSDGSDSHFNDMTHEKTFQFEDQRVQQQIDICIQLTISILH